MSVDNRKALSVREGISRNYTRSRDCTIAVRQWIFANTTGQCHSGKAVLAPEHEVTVRPGNIRTQSRSYIEDAFAR